ncbi:flavin-containing monooxygenase [Actinomadura madurae]|nr:NAD(P)/FAD-dependent oxidoreductase [Actinomadura madurae]MCP9955443.1 NAD(P)/FAD-dependent oxidoreductase [Actinomadura madurae]MCQ0003768.1 NAD(P)/FAD-dependent oxidoreductase [Actinomadura madurae]MCQ0020873.1 NAD(P)/FAD-dependent oxidoreductase [Actinomadura madurae]
MTTTIATDWLTRFGDALERGADLSGLFAPECHWRDVVSFTGDLRTFSHTRAPAELSARQPRAKAANLRLAAGRTPPREVERNGVTCVEAIFEFDLALGRGLGVVRLVPGPDGRCVARNLFTALDEIAGRPEPVGAHRPTGQADSSKFGGPNWLDRRHAAVAYADHDPDVLIVGAGQSGLALAARLGRLDVDALVVDAHERPGDNWRKRYHALTLHNAVWLNDLPYMPFPPTWPVFVPKDKLAGWFEAYVEAMEINFWGSSTFEHGAFDEATGTWEARIRRAGGGHRTLRPRHIVLATGVSGIPYRPDLPGLGDFGGRVLHSADYTGGADHAGERVVIIGTGNSAHDIAQDLHANGAAVTMVQRNSTTVVSVDPSAALGDASYLTAPTLEDSDLIGLSVPYPDLVTGSKALTEAMKEMDADLIAGLERAGFRTDYGEDGTGQQMKFMRRGGGYYLNVGCSELIISGAVGLAQFADTDRFVKEGLRMRDGSVLGADLVVLATGFHPQQENVRRLMGGAVADAVGPIWGYDDEGELRNMWRPTAQPGLWCTAGNFQMCRTYSKVLALQLRLALDRHST